MDIFNLIFEWDDELIKNTEYINIKLQSIEIIVKELFNNCIKNIMDKISYMENSLNIEYNGSFEIHNYIKKIKAVKKNIELIELFIRKLTEKNKMYYVLIFYLFYINFNDISININNNLTSEEKKKFHNINNEWKKIYDIYMSNLLIFIGKNMLDEFYDWLLDFTIQLIFIYKIYTE